jgi:hypothetical protein
VEREARLLELNVGERRGLRLSLERGRCEGNETLGEGNGAAGGPPMLRRRAKDERRECLVAVGLDEDDTPSTDRLGFALAALDRRLCFFAALESVAGSAGETLIILSLASGTCLGRWRTGGTAYDETRRPGRRD